MTIHNTGTKGDNNIEKIRLAKPHEYEQIMEREFGEAGDEDEKENFGGMINHSRLRPIRLLSKRRISM